MNDSYIESFAHKSSLPSFSKNATSSIIPFTNALNLILPQNSLFLLFRKAFHRNLVEIGIKFVVVAFNFAVVADGDTCLIVAKNPIVFNLGETRSRTNNATALIFVNLVV